MFTITLPGGSKVNMADFDIGVLGDIARSCNLQWTDVYAGPLKDDRAAVALYREACERSGVEVPKQLTPSILIEAFDITRVNEELPTSYADGLPKEADETTTVS